MSIVATDVGYSGPADEGTAAGVTIPDSGWWVGGLTPEERRAPHGPPEWARRAETMLAELPAAPALPAVPAEAAAAGSTGLATIVAPFAGLAVDRFTAAVRAEALGTGVDLNAVCDGLVAGLKHTMVSLAGSTLLLELSLLRVGGRLTGDTSRQRFWSFVRHFTRPHGLAALLAKYPVLARLLVHAADRAAVAWVALLRRLITDRWLIVGTVFGDADPGRLVEATFRGRGPDSVSVALLRFAGGRRLVYRTRPITEYLAFQETVGWLNRRLPWLRLRTPKVLDRGDHGWVEFIEWRRHRDAAEHERHLRRHGALLALLHALNGGDLDGADIIAAGEQPVLVDLSGLLQPAPPGSRPTATNPSHVAFAVSALRSGLLLTSAASHATDVPAPSWIAAGTDEMRVAEPAPTAGRSRRHAPAVPVTPAGQDALLAGFVAAYDAIVAGREELSGPGGPLYLFAGAQRPAPARTASSYRELLARSTHPDLLRDALERDRFLSGMAPGALRRKRLARAEVAALRAGTIPDVSTRAGSRDVVVGDDVLRGELEQTALSHAAGKIRALDPRDRARQEWLIRAWLGAGAAPAAGAAVAVAAPVVPSVADEVDPRRCLAAAERIADRLAEAAYGAGEQVGWLGLTSADESHWAVGPLGVGLCDGYPGVALFLAKLAELTGEQRYATLAVSALAHVPSMLAGIDGPVGIPADEGSRAGPFHGVSGLAYAAVHIAASLRDASWLDWLPALLPSAAAPLARPDPAFDVAGGLAGCSAALLAVHVATGSPPARRIGQLCAQLLARQAKPREQGVSWPAGAGFSPVGFARGTSGAGWALLRYTAVTGDPQFAETGIAAFRHEREQYQKTGLPPRPGWCHGAAGIGLSRVDSLHAEDPDLAGDLDLALRVVVSAPPAADHSLCHGELANLELLTAAIESGRTDLTGVRLRRANGLLDAIDQHGPRCGTPGAVATPGLLTGLSGIGYGLLRLAFPDRVPSVLLLEPPSRRLAERAPKADADDEP